MKMGAELKLQGFDGAKLRLNFSAGDKNAY